MKKEEGAKGVAKGLSKGLVSLTMKTGAGVVGLVAYPGQGLCKSVRSAVRTDTRMRITRGKRSEREWLRTTDMGRQADADQVVRSFISLRKGKQKQR